MPCIGETQERLIQTQGTSGTVCSGEILAGVQMSINNKKEELGNSYTREQSKAITVTLASHRRNNP